MDDDKNLKLIRTLQRDSKANKLCFECRDRGPSYLAFPMTGAGPELMPTFVCVTCAGLLRDFNYRVKGISMSTFTAEEMDKVKTGGNSRAAKLWLAKMKPDATDELPAPGQTEHIRRYLRKKYQDKRWYRDPSKKKKKEAAPKAKAESTDDSDSSSSSSDDTERRRRAAKKALKDAKKEGKKLKKKKDKKKKKKASDSSSSSEAEEEATAPRPKDIKDIMPDVPKLVVGSSSNTPVTQAPKAAGASEFDLLGWDTEPTPVPSAASQSNEWGDFSGQPGTQTGYGHENAQSELGAMQQPPQQAQQPQVSHGQGAFVPPAHGVAQQYGGAYQAPLQQRPLATSALDDPFAALAIETPSPSAARRRSSANSVGSFASGNSGPSSVPNGGFLGSSPPQPGYGGVGGGGQLPSTAQQQGAVVGGFGQQMHFQQQAVPQQQQQQQFVPHQQHNAQQYAQQGQQQQGAFGVPSAHNGYIQQPQQGMMGMPPPNAMHGQMQHSPQQGMMGMPQQQPQHGYLQQQPPHNHQFAQNPGQGQAYGGMQQPPPMQHQQQPPHGAMQQPPPMQRQQQTPYGAMPQQQQVHMNQAFGAMGAMHPPSSAQPLQQQQQQQQAVPAADDSNPFDLF